jgi:hypothetical protein
VQPRWGLTFWVTFDERRGRDMKFFCVYLRVVICRSLSKFNLRVRYSVSCGPNRLVIASSLALGLPCADLNHKHHLQ